MNCPLTLSFIFEHCRLQKHRPTKETVHLIQKFRIQVEEEAAKKLEKMGVTEACERIKESVYLAAKRRDSGVWYIFFDQKRFQRPDFEKFKSIYVEAFKSRWKKCGLDDSLVDYKNDALYIKDAIDINFVKKIEEVLSFALCRVL